MRVSKQRYLELVEANSYPVCRTNGCHKLVRGRKGDLAAILETGRAGLELVADGRKRARNGRSLVNWRVKLTDDDQLP